MPIYREDTKEACDICGTTLQQRFVPASKGPMPNPTMERLGPVFCPEERNHPTTEQAAPQTEPDEHSEAEQPEPQDGDAIRN